MKVEISKENSKQVNEDGIKIKVLEEEVRKAKAGNFMVMKVGTGFLEKILNIIHRLQKENKGLKIHADQPPDYYKIGFKEGVTALQIQAKEEAFAVFMGEPIIRVSKIDEICEELTEGF